MPKIIIREYDNTKAVNGATGNFSVVVPGKVAESKGITGFDSNGVCEVSTEQDFLDKIGKVPGCTEGEAGVAPTLEAITSADTTAGCTVVAGAGIALCTCNDAQALASLWGNHSATGKVYTAAVDSSKTVEGHLVIKDGTNYYSLTAITIETEWVENTIYCVVKNGKEGSDAVNVAYNGNQIAYELVKAGYTVLYKKFDSISELLGTSNTFFDCFKDKSTYDFRYITTGGLFDLDTETTREVEVYNNIIKVAQFTNDDTTVAPGRGDCVALLDVNEKGISVSDPVTGITTYVTGLTNADKYSAIFTPKVTYDDVDDNDEPGYGTNHTFPASVDYLLCAAYARDRLNFNEWYAVAGYNRGVSEKIIKATSLQLGEIAINALQPRTSGGIAKSVNVITKIRGNYYLWGNRTAHALTADGLVASHFLNIRQLCSTLKKDIWNACKSLTFDPNSDVLWGTFCNKIKATLEKMKADQGIADYRILKVTSKVKAKLTAKVRIVPIEAVEDFEINIYLEDSLSGVDVKSSEEE